MRLTVDIRVHEYAAGYVDTSILYGLIKKYILTIAFTIYPLPQSNSISKITIYRPFTCQRVGYDDYRKHFSYIYTFCSISQ